MSVTPREMPCPSQNDRPPLRRLSRHPRRDDGRDQHRRGHPRSDDRSAATRSSASTISRAEDVVSAIFTTTPELTAAFPALAARELGWTEVAASMRS